MLQGFAGSALGLSQSVGLGTFVADEHARTPTTATQLLLAPRFGFDLGGVALAVSARQTLSWEETQPDNPTGRRFDLDDTRLSVAAPRLLVEPFTGVGLTPSVRYLLPTSYASQGAGSHGTLGLGLGLARGFGSDSGNQVEVAYAFAFNKGFARYTAKGVASGPVADPEGRAVVLCRSGESTCASAGMNTDYSFANTLSLRWAYGRRVSVGLGLTLVNQFGYPAAAIDDPYTSTKTDVDGNPVARTGAGRRDVVWGSFDVEVALTERWSVGISVTNVGPTRTRDNQRLRFPFFDTESAADNLTSFSLGVTATL